MCAIATPFRNAGELDEKVLRSLIDYQIDNGTQVLVLAGSTGEAHFLEHDEYTRLLALAIEHVNGRVPVIAGTGEAGTAKTIALTRHAVALGVDAALVVTPYYVRPTQEGLRRHFLAVADNAGAPVVLYNVPSRSACDMTPDTVGSLSAHPAIIGIKEAVGDKARIAAMAALANPDFAYLSGDDYTAMQAMLAGASGTVSVVANLVPRLFRRLCDAARAGDGTTASQCAQRMQPLLDAMNCAPNPIPVKTALGMLGFGDGTLRLPLHALDDEAALAALRKALRELVPERFA